MSTPRPSRADSDRRIAFIRSARRRAVTNMVTGWIRFGSDRDDPWNGVECPSRTVTRARVQERGGEWLAPGTRIGSMSHDGAGARIILQMSGSDQKSRSRADFESPLAARWRYSCQVCRGSSVTDLAFQAASQRLPDCWRRSQGATDERGDARLQTSR